MNLRNDLSDMLERLGLVWASELEKQEMQYYLVQERINDKAYKRKFFYLDGVNQRDPWHMHNKTVEMPEFKIQYTVRKTGNKKLIRRLLERKCEGILIEHEETDVPPEEF